MKKDNVLLYLQIHAGRKKVQEGHTTVCQAGLYLSTNYVNNLIYLFAEKLSDLENKYLQLKI
jgi:hypothetical protein